MRYAIAAVGVIACFAIAPVRAAELRSLQAPVELSFAHSADGSRAVQLQLEALPRLELDFAGGARLVTSLRLRIDAEDQLDPGRPAFDSYSPASEPVSLGSAGTLELRDAYWEQRLARGIVRLGKQQIVWGRLDGIKVLDVLNPQSFREFILDDFDDSRISLWSAYADLFVGAWRLELAAIPDYTAHEIPERGAWFELTAPRFRFGAAPTAATPSPALERGRDALHDGALAARLSGTAGRLSVSMIAYSGNDHEPLARLETRAGRPTLERFHERRELVGIGAETAVGSLALRAEAALQPSRTFNTRSATGLATVDADQFSLGLGADFDAPLGVFLNVQLLWDEVLDAPGPLVRPDRDRLGTVFARRSFNYDTTTLEARWYHSFDDADDLFRLRVAHDLDDETTFYVEGDWFDGTRAGLFGQFRARDRIVFGLRHTF